MTKYMPIATKNMAFTLVEVLVAMFLLGLLSLGGMLSYGRVHQQEELVTTATQIAQLLNLARVRSVGGDQDTTWKVSLTATAVYLQDAANNTYEQYNFPANVRLDPGALTAVEFTRASGRVVACQPECIITLNRISGSDSHQLGIRYSGIVEY